MRRDLSIEELRDLLERPIVAVLATYAADGHALLSPVWHEWRDDGFNVVATADDVKVRHLRRDPTPEPASWCSTRSLPIGVWSFADALGS